jgi:DNA-binding CsgD family transcriptional regulator/tetratricopeptide (TPR) repeat protein
MLVGRERERRVIQSVLAAARVGKSAVLVLTGEAGIGKTALLDHAATFATGMRLLRATGTESESEVPFGALLQLLQPALVHLDRIPTPQADALAAALALRRPGTGGDRFAIGAATLSLLSRYAEDQPLALLVDDAHLLDLPSAQALTFAARRLTADPVAVLAAVRDGHSCPVTEADLPVLHVGGLSLAAASDLLATGGRQLGEHVIARLYDLTGGNPLALVELVDDVDGLHAVPSGAPFPVPASLARAFGRRADRLSDAARTTVLVAAAAGGEGDLALVARACQLLDVDVATLEEAESAGLLSVGADGIAFRHSLVRSAVYSAAAAGTRRAVHRALARALPEHDIDRRAWHLGEAALGPDEDTARALESAAARARARSAHAVAAGAFERAARLSEGPDRCARRLVSAAESAWQAGMSEQAVALLTQASELHPAPALRARAAGLRGAIAARTGSVEDARDVLLAAGIEIADADADTAIMLLADAILACFFLGDTSTVLDAVTRIDMLVDRGVGEQARLVGAMAGGVAGVLTGRGGPERIRRAVEQVVPAGEFVQDLRIAPWLVIGPLFLRESDTGRTLVQTVVESLRRHSVIGGLPFLLFHVARDQATTDRWDVAELTYSEGIQLAREAGHSSDLAACLAGLAWLEARQGREARCREHADEALQICSARHIALFQAWSLFAMGELELGLGRSEAAIAHLERLDALLADIGLVDVDLSPAPELVDALVRVGQDEMARDVAQRYAARAVDKGQPWALARGARAVALTCPDSEIDQHFGRALDHHARTLDSFESARTQLAYGARLRRDRRRVDARVPLRAALVTFETLGAAPWADQSAIELRATGETAHRRGATPLDELTPQELQVARMLAGGRTTKEVAAALFLSPKTVEYHLRHVYIKLGIRSRTELANSLDARS